MFPAAAKATQAIQLFHPSALKKRVLEDLAEFYALTVKDLVSLIYPTPNETHEGSVRRCLSALDRDGLVNRISYRPDDYPGYGTLPLACGLSFDGLLWAQGDCAWTDPKELIKDHSPITLEHEIKRARFHMKVVALCEQHTFELFWKKTDLNHTVLPDDVFAIKGNVTTTYYFFELENKRKCFQELLKKYERYAGYYGTDHCRRDWKDFQTFIVVTQMRTEEVRTNLLRFLAGEPVTEYRGGKGRSIINSTPIRRGYLWFSTEADPFTFKTPLDYRTAAYTFLTPRA
jgi:hypothetical protein